MPKAFVTYGPLGWHRRYYIKIVPKKRFIRYGQISSSSKSKSTFRKESNYRVHFTEWRKKHGSKSTIDIPKLFTSYVHTQFVWSYFELPPVILQIYYKIAYRQLMSSRPLCLMASLSSSKGHKSRESFSLALYLTPRRIQRLSNPSWRCSAISLTISKKSYPLHSRTFTCHYTQHISSFTNLVLPDMENRSCDDGVSPLSTRKSRDYVTRNLVWN